MEHEEAQRGKLDWTPNWGSYRASITEVWSIFCVCVILSIKLFISIAFAYTAPLSVPFTYTIAYFNALAAAK